MGVKFTNNAKTTLNGSILPGATTIVVTDGSVFPTLSAGEFFWLTLEDNTPNREIVKVTARATHSLTVVRGQEGTTPFAFASGSRAELRVTAGMLNDLTDAVDKLNSIKPPIASLWRFS